MLLRWSFPAGSFLATDAYYCCCPATDAYCYCCIDHLQLVFLPRPNELAQPLLLLLGR